MKTASRLFALTCALGALFSAGSAQARADGEGWCERQLEQCLMYAIIPEPCYLEYERCLWNWGARGGDVATANTAMRRD
jgi:hypothetical protein